MAFLGNEIIQTRQYIDPNPKAPPNKNYKLTFPITVYRAVKRDMEDGSITLDQEIDSIIQNLNNKQNMIPAKSGNHIVTYGGIAGIVGSVRMVDKISWDPKKWTNNRIPTEKAVGELMMKYGLGEKDDTKIGDTIPWANILGKPEIYDKLGDDVDGLISQAAITEIFNTSINDLLFMDQNITEEMANLTEDYLTHKNNTDNPHQLTAEIIGAVNKEDFKEHKNNRDNPHQVTKEQVGLNNVDNTADRDKPISILTQNEIDKINQKLSAIDAATGLMNFIENIEYNQITGRLDAIYADGSRRGVNIITNTLIDEIEFDKSKSSIIVTELSGLKKEVSLKAMENKYIGLEGNKINIIINTDNSISARINPKSITKDDIADKTIEGSLIADNTISDSNLKNESITNDKIKNQTITGDKIANQTIQNDHIKNISISIDKILGADRKDMLLVSKTPNTNPSWSKLTRGLLSEELVEGKHIANKTITNQQITDFTIINSSIADRAINNKKIEDKTITNDKIVNGTITAPLIDPDITFLGNPKVDNQNIEDNSIISSKWVKDYINGYKITDNNINPRFINGKYLFSSRIKNRVLLVPEVDADPVWGQITEDMIAPQGIDGERIKDKSITAIKIKDENIISRHIMSRAILNTHIADSNITSEKIFPSDQNDMVLAVINNNRHPIYSKVTNRMIENDAITNQKLANESITLNKIAKEGTTNTILGVRAEGQSPEWVKINTNMILNNAITSSKLFRSENPNMVLATKDADAPALYMKVSGDMLEINTLDNKHMKDNSINAIKIIDKSITNDKISENTITGSRIKENAITGHHIIKTDIPFQVLGTDNRPQDGAKWLTLIGDMFAKNSIDINKLKKPNISNSILGIKSLTKDLEFVKISNEFIEDDSIDSSKLNSNLLFKGNPRIESTPSIDSDDNIIPNTSWVNMKLSQASSTMNSPARLLETIGRLTELEINNIKTRLNIIDVNSLTQDEIRNKVNEAIGELNNLIKNSNIQGTVEEIITRKVNEKISSGISLSDNSVSTIKIQNNAITTEKIQNNAITSEKINNKSIRENHLSDNKLINEIHIYDNAISSNKIKDNSITNDKILKNSIDGNRLKHNTSLPSNTKIDKSPYEQSSMRNIIISNKPPRGINDDIINGTIWLQYN